MVARLLRLRVALLVSVFRGGAGRVIRRVLFGIVLVLAAVVFAWLPDAVDTRLSDRASLDIVFGSTVLACALVVPFFANRRLLEPRQFSSVPERPASIAGSLLLTTVLSWPALWLLLWLTAVAVLRPEWGEAWWAVVLAVLLTVVLAVVMARFAAGLSRLIVPTRVAGSVRAIGVVLVLAALPVAVFGVAQAIASPRSTAVADVAAALGWSPFGAPLAGLTSAVEGDVEGALLRFGIAVIVCGVFAVLWFVIVKRSVQSVEPPLPERAARSGLGWFERMPARRYAVIGARALTYWSRDPRYRVAFAMIPLALAVMLAAFWIAGVRWEYLALVPVPVIALMLGWSLHNDVAMDSTAIWSHIASGTRGWADRLGRLFPVLLIGLPFVVIGSSVTVTVVGEWRTLPAVMGMNIGILLASCGASSVFSALLPYPATRPGDSPFAQPAVSGSGSGAAQTLSMLTAALLSVAPVWVAIDAMTAMTLGDNLLALVFGVGYGVVVLALGVLLGGKLFDRAGPELIALTQTFD